MLGPGQEEEAIRIYWDLGPLDSHLLCDLGRVTSSLWPWFPTIMHIEEVGPGDQQGACQPSCSVISKGQVQRKDRRRKQPGFLKCPLHLQEQEQALGFGSTGRAELNWVAAPPSEAWNWRVGMNLRAACGHFQSISGSLRRNVCEQCRFSKTGHFSRAWIQKDRERRGDKTHFTWCETHNLLETCLVSQKDLRGLQALRQFSKIKMKSVT